MARRPRILVVAAFFFSVVRLLAGQMIIQPTETNIDAMIRQGGVLDLHTLDELERTAHDQASTRSEATVSKLDLKAPGSARKEYNKGLLSLARNDNKSAANSFKKATSIYPQFVSAHNALGCAYVGLRQNELAREEFEQAIQLDDHLSGSYLNLGRTELALGHIAAAQAAMEKASALAPLDPNLHLALTYTQFLNHDYSGAIQTAERAHAGVHRGTAVVHYFAAASWQAQNKLEEAQSQLEMFLSEDPSSPFADAARRIVEQIKAREVQSLNLTLAVNASPGSAATADDSSRARKVLQDLREKRQIAEAENAAGAAAEAGNAQPVPQSEIARNLPGRGVTPSSAGGFRLRTAVNEVAVFFTATDHGKAVSDLTQGETTILDDKQPPAAVLGFHPESDLPLRLGLLIDTSESVTDRLLFEQSAAATFLQQVLTDKGDLAFVAGFSNSIVLVQDFTADLGQLSHGVGQLAPVGGTALWDSVAFAADKLVQRKEGRPVARILVVISDGDDNSSASSLKEAIEQAQHEDVIVYAVSTRDNDPDKQNEATGNRALKVLAEQTGGAAFFPGTAGHLGHSLAELREVIRSRYLVSYKPAQFHHDGRYRAIHITAQRSGHKLKVVSRKGYYANKNSAGAGSF